MQPVSAYLDHYDLHYAILTALNEIAVYPATRIEADAKAMRMLNAVNNRLHDLLVRFENEDEAALERT